MEEMWDHLMSMDLRKLTTDGLKDHLTKLREYQNSVVSKAELQITMLLENGNDVNVGMVHATRQLLLDLIVRRDRITTLRLTALRTGNDDEDEKRLNREAVSIKKFKNTGAESSTRLNVAEKQWEEKMIAKRKQEREEQKEEEEKERERRERKRKRN